MTETVKCRAAGPEYRMPDLVRAVSYQPPGEGVAPGNLVLDWMAWQVQAEMGLSGRTDLTEEEEEEIFQEAFARYDGEEERYAELFYRSVGRC